MHMARYGLSLSLLLLLFLIVGSGWAQTVDIIPITIREGLSSYGTKKSDIRASSYFQEQQALADKAGIRLEDFLDEKIVAESGKQNFYLLFHNHIQARQCPREYLIQRVKLTKGFFRNGHKVGTQNEYLVEIMKINEDKRTKKPDQHYKRYGLKGYDARSLDLLVEVGCGEIPGVVEGDGWPYASNKLYHRLQDYSEDPGYYETVRFEFSRTYELKAYFSRDNKLRMDLPSFLE